MVLWVAIMLTATLVLYYLQGLNIELRGEWEPGAASLPRG